MTNVNVFELSELVFHEVVLTLDIFFAQCVSRMCLGQCRRGPEWGPKFLDPHVPPGPRVEWHTYSYRVLNLVIFSFSVACYRALFQPLRDGIETGAAGRPSSSVHLPV